MQRFFPNHRVVHAETPADFKEHSVDDALAILSGKVLSSLAGSSDFKVAESASPAKASGDAVVSDGFQVAAENETAAAAQDIAQVKNTSPVDQEISAVDELVLASIVASEIDHAVAAQAASDSLAAVKAEVVVAAAAAGDSHPDITLAIYDFICGRRA